MWRYIINIKDVKPLLSGAKDDAFKFLFDKQFELYKKYKEIEGMPDHYPLDINTKDTQVWIKDFIWRVLEELVEFYEAYIEKDEGHKIDELSDSLHFFIEIYVLLDYKIILLDDHLKNHKYREISSEFDLKSKIFDITYFLGFASNALKNRKWKSTEVLVDLEKFYYHLNKGFFLMIDLILDSFSNRGDDNKLFLLNLYHLKNEVNKFRIRTNY